MIDSWFQRVYEWNRDRQNLEYNAALEHRMLTEELKEYADGVSLIDRVEQVDAICDLIFVALGTLVKMEYQWGFDVTKAMEAVLDANDDKPKERVNGKIIKGNKWRDPKEKIAELVNGKTM